jgi:HK97 family phage major capsid protein
MKIKTYAQLQAARARQSDIMNNRVSKGASFSKPFLNELKALTVAILEVEDADIESTLKYDHTQIKTKTAKAKEIKSMTPLQIAIKALGNKLIGKSTLLHSGDGSDLAIAELVSGAIVKRVTDSRGVLNAINIQPLASVKTRFLRELTKPQIERYAQSDGTIGFTRADTATGSFINTKFTLSDLYHKVPVTDEAKHDIPKAVESTLISLSDQYEKQYGLEVLVGESANAELPGMCSDLLDLGNDHAESLVADATRDINTFGAILTGISGDFSLTPHAKFHELVATLPAKLKNEAAVYMNRNTLEAYSKFVDDNNRPLFSITKDSFETYPLVIDDNMPNANTNIGKSKAIVGFGVPDKALALGNIDIKFLEDEFSSEGVTLFKNVGRIGGAVKDNTAMRFLLAKA